MWHAFRVAFPLRSPLHVGWRTTGNLKQTRPYLIGRSFWGALTARVARDLLDGDYREADIQVRRNVVHTYFYPSVNPDRVDLWPWGRDRDRFAWLHLDSFSSTALVDGRAKLDGSLHETELIAPVARDGSPVWLVGYVWYTDAGLKLVSAETLGRLQFGGERGYGWGRVSRPSIEPLCSSDLLFGLWRWAEEQGQIVVRPPASERVPVVAHVAIDEAGSAEARNGRVEALVGRLTTDSRRLQFGGAISAAEICLSPGSPSSAGYSIGSFGIWRGPISRQLSGPI
jgi:hypothetical protein